MTLVTTATFIDTKTAPVTQAIRLFRRHWVAIPLILLAFAGAWLLVYADGGTKYAHLHAIYFPILLAAFRYDEIGGFTAGLVGMILMGPLMPLDVAAGELQPTANWLFRGLYLCAIGVIIGLLNRLVLRGREERFRLANYDASTELPLAAPLRRHIREVLEAKGGSTGGHAVIHLSLTNGDNIHSSFGVDAYEMLMRSCAQRIGGSIPEGGFLARGGQSRFLCFLINTTEDAAVAVGRDLQAALRAPLDMGGLPALVDCEIGIATYPEHGADPEELLRASFAAIARAGQAPNRTVHLFDSEQDGAQRDNLRLLSELRGAIDERRLIFHAQPKFGADGSLWGAELLVRWPHPAGGFIMPGRFIPLAEQSRMIFDVTRLCFEAARDHMAQIREMTPRAGLHFSVNISGSDLSDPRFPEMLHDAFGDDPADLALLELEITETAIIEDLERLIPVLERVRETGVRIAIDDFGTGYSSLTYLKKIPADTLKIDQSFVRGVLESERDAILVRRTIQLGKDLGMDIVAEGVETQEIADWLVANGCDRLQGYFFSKPLPAPEWRELAADRVRRLTPDFTASE
ncbi:putative bifunctional diguanylate cyclase/phosphodiesterase [Minwuia thermotolerans]|uniref:GGDEF domain-containing protein n=1 Tax=Minwuia thermotolerans TaxID=2056226 RepID=A0A2M9G2N0_9PROT|nr:GGDEF domain-containing phosphodiesterase [Minwuia thermotolerans]PJK29979.1 hypothetical protein CVT23_09435 [Minwuia thermotolerans]